MSVAVVLGALFLGGCSGAGSVNGTIVEPGPAPDIVSVATVSTASAPARGAYAAPSHFPVDREWRELLDLSRLEDVWSRSYNTSWGTNSVNNNDYSAANTGTQYASIYNYYAGSWASSPKVECLPVDSWYNFMPNPGVGSADRFTTAAC